MTHYTINYEGIAEPAKTAKALQDFRDYVGEKAWSKLGEAFIQPGATLGGYTNRKSLIQSIRFACAMLGVRGFPERAYLRAIMELHK